MYIVTLARPVTLGDVQLSRERPQAVTAAEFSILLSSGALESIYNPYQAQLPKKYQGMDWFELHSCFARKIADSTAKDDESFCKHHKLPAKFLQFLNLRYQEGDNHGTDS